MLESLAASATSGCRTTLPMAAAPKADSLVYKNCVSLAGEETKSLCSFPILENRFVKKYRGAQRDGSCTAQKGSRSNEEYTGEQLDSSRSTHSTYLPFKEPLEPGTLLHTSTSVEVKVWYPWVLSNSPYVHLIHWQPHCTLHHWSQVL